MPELGKDKIKIGTVNKDGTITITDHWGMYTAENDGVGVVHQFLITEANQNTNEGQFS